MALAPHGTTSNSHKRCRAQLEDPSACDDGAGSGLWQLADAALLLKEEGASACQGAPAQARPSQQRQASNKRAATGQHRHSKPPLPHASMSKGAISTWRDGRSTASISVSPDLLWAGSSVSGLTDAAGVTPALSRGSSPASGMAAGGAMTVLPGGSSSQLCGLHSSQPSPAGASAVCAALGITDVALMSMQSRLSSLHELYLSHKDAYLQQATEHLQTLRSRAMVQGPCGGSDSHKAHSPGVNAVVRALETALGIITASKEAHLATTKTAPSAPAPTTAPPPAGLPVSEARQPTNSSRHLPSSHGPAATPPPGPTAPPMLPHSTRHGCQGSLDHLNAFLPAPGAAAVLAQSQPHSLAAVAPALHRGDGTASVPLVADLLAASQLMMAQQQQQQAMLAPQPQQVPLVMLPDGQLVVLQAGLQLPAAQQLGPLPGLQAMLHPQANAGIEALA